MKEARKRGKWYQVLYWKRSKVKRKGKGKGKGKGEGEGNKSYT